MTLRSLAAAAGFAALAALPAVAHEHGKAPAPDAIAIAPLAAMEAAEITGKNVTVLEVTLQPGAAMPSHRHPGPAFVYVLEGTVVSQLGTDAGPVTYSAGQSWYEPPNAHHVAMSNPSETEPAKILAVMTGEADADLVQPDAPATP